MGRERTTGKAEVTGSTNILTFTGATTLRVPGTRLLRTRLGQWLENRGLLTRATIGIVFVICAWAMTQPGWCTYRTTLDGKVYVLRQPDVGQAIVALLLMCIVWVLIAQRANRSLFRLTLLSFPCAVVLASGVFGVIVFEYNTYMVFYKTGVIDLTALLVGLARDAVVVVPCNIVFGTFDSFLLRKRYRVLLTLIFIVNVAMRWAKERFGPDNFWSSSEVCLWLWCGTPKSVYIACLAQTIIFLSKAAYSYMVGYPFATIQSTFSFSDIERQSLRRQSCLDEAKASTELHPAVPNCGCIAYQGDPQWSPCERNASDAQGLHSDSRQLEFETQDLVVANPTIGEGELDLEAVRSSSVFVSLDVHVLRTGHRHLEAEMQDTVAANQTIAEGELDLETGRSLRVML